MRTLAYTLFGLSMALGIATPALADDEPKRAMHARDVFRDRHERHDRQHERIEQKHDRQHDRLKDRHGREHDRLETRHDRAHDRDLSRREHRRLHERLEDRHDRVHDKLRDRHRDNHARIERRHDEYRERDYWERRYRYDRDWSHFPRWYGYSSYGLHGDGWSRLGILAHDPRVARWVLYNFDYNGNGRLGDGEAADARHAIYDMADRNRDGYLSRHELAMWRNFAARW